MCPAFIQNQVEVHHNWTPLPGSSPPLWYNDPRNDPAAREYIDARCNYVDRQGNIIHTGAEWFGEGCHGNVLCPPDVVVTCPSPTPGPTPTPGPDVDDRAPTCPRLDCIHANVHNIMGPDFLPRPEPVEGGYVVIDSTPLFETCTSAGRCNAEKHWRCTKSLRDHETTNPEHLRSVLENRECRSYRQCEDPAGYCWRRLEGPNVDYTVQGPGPVRGYQLRLGPLVPGDYRWLVYASSDCPARDAEGVPVPGQASGEVSFSVR